MLMLVAAISDGVTGQIAVLTITMTEAITIDLYSRADRSSIKCVATVH